MKRMCVCFLDKDRADDRMKYRLGCLFVIIHYSTKVPRFQGRPRACNGPLAVAKGRHTRLRLS
jgi:hypothetical protein